MKIKYSYIFILLLFLTASCKDEALIENQTSAEDFNIKEFSEGFSLAFDITLDDFGGGISSRAAGDEEEIINWENYLNPEEFRVIIFDQNDQYLFESKTRWLTSIASHGGGSRWRVGVPVFQYVADNYDDTDPENSGIPVPAGEYYNWDKIVEIMTKEPFKVAILANRPSKVEVPELSDWKDDDDFKDIAQMGSALNGPFWTAKNSIATENVNINDVAKVIDLHHCQFDPLYYYKSENGGNFKASGDGWYDFIMDYDNYEDKKSGNSLSNVPFMGAAASWVSANRSRVVPDKYNAEPRTARTIRYYRLPVDRKGDKHPDNGSLTGFSSDYVENYSDLLDEDQFIPMYGIQKYDALTTWEKGKTYNLSEQTGSQTGNYQYKSIKLLRSVVKLELRIPMYDDSGKYIDIDNAWAQIWLNNYMSRCEPMDVSTPTNEIWSDEHDACEWTSIRDYGLLADNDGSAIFKEKLGWFYGSWLEMGWQFKEGKDKLGQTINIPSTKPYPRIFNPLTQRLQGAFITDCYLPINGDPNHKEQSFHRWVIYCGERNMNDPNYVGDPTSTGTITFFRIHVSRKENKDSQTATDDRIYYIPITDYSYTSNPANDYLVETNYPVNEKNGNAVKNIYYMDGVTDHMSDYLDNMMNETTKEYFPYPLLRNHFYRITVSFKDSDNGIDVKVVNAEKRTVGGIEFD